MKDNQDNLSLREEILKIVTYHSEEATSGYFISEKKIDEILEKFKTILDGLEGEEMKFFDDNKNFQDGYNVAVGIFNQKLLEAKEKLE